MKKLLEKLSKLTLTQVVKLLVLIWILVSLVIALVKNPELLTNDEFTTKLFNTTEKIDTIVQPETLPEETK